METVTNTTVPSAPKVLIRHCRKYTTKVMRFAPKAVTAWVPSISSRSSDEGTILGFDGLPVISLLENTTKEQLNRSFVEAKVTSSKKTGTLIAIKNDKGNVVIGWSRPCKKLVKADGWDLESIKQMTNEEIESADHKEYLYDRFNAETGRRIALERARIGHSIPIPNSMVEDVKRFVERAKKYFKVKKVTVVGLTKGTYAERENVIPAK